MIAVYPLGFQSVWHNNELRYSLRSLEQYLPQITEVQIITGDMPTWCDVTHIPAIDGHDRVKNIWNKAELINTQSEPILYMADDIFFTATPERMPMYYDDTIDKKIKGATGRYKDMLVATRRYLKYHNLPTLNFALHYPLVIYPHILKDALTHRAENLSFRLIYCNLSHHYHMQDIEERQDCKLWNISEYTGQEVFSISDRFLTRDGMALFQQLYPNVSKFEKD